jgi:hypothetical protein
MKSKQSIESKVMAFRASLINENKEIMNDLMDRQNVVSEEEGKKILIYHTKQQTVIDMLDHTLFILKETAIILPSIEQN